MSRNPAQRTSRGLKPSMSAARPASMPTKILGLGILVLQVVAKDFLGLMQKRRPEIFHALHQVAIESFPIVGLATAFAGFVVTTEIAWHMDLALHTIQIVPGFAAQFIIRELAVAVPAMLIVAKIGASITAELGTMKVTEQIDALKLLRVDPIQALVVPRWIATLLGTVILVFLSIGVTLFCSLLVSVFKFGFTSGEFLNALRQFVGPIDLISALTKAAVFGALIPLVSCAYAFECEGGAEGVGKSTTDSVVASTLLVILCDFLISAAFNLFLVS